MCQQGLRKILGELGHVKDFIKFLLFRWGSVYDSRSREVFR